MGVACEEEDGAGDIGHSRGEGHAHEAEDQVDQDQLGVSGEAGA